MKISKIFHLLYLTLLVLPVLAIPIFAVYSHRHTIEGNQAEIQENLKVDFNQIQPKLTDSFYFNNMGGNFNVDNQLLTFTATVTGANVSDYPQRFDINSSHIYIVSTKVNFSNEYVAFRLNYVSYYPSAINTDTLLRVRVTNVSSFYYTFIDNSSTPSGYPSTASNFCLFDLTQMFGSGNEPTLEEFNAYFPNAYYDYTLSKDVWLENYQSETYIESDIISQFSYSIYNATENYLNFDNFFAFGDIHTWLVNNFFGGVPSLYFTIAWHFLTYWFVVSIFWLLFDVLMYVPNLVHRWLDRGAIQ